MDMDNNGNLYLYVGDSGSGLYSLYKYDTNSATASWENFPTRPASLQDYTNTLLFDEQTGKLIVGGTFSQSGSDLNYIAQIPVSNPSEESYEPFGHGLYDNGFSSSFYSGVKTLVMNSEGTLFAGGAFTQNNTGEKSDTGDDLHNVAYWDNSTQTWHPVGLGFNDFVRVLYFDSAGNLYAGGAFTEDGIEETSLPYIAEYTDGTWQSLQSTTSSENPDKLIRTMTSNAPLVLSSE
ncbi:MAG: hypothetical protein AAGA27_03650 [Pseudomonadota bacterium]